MSGWHGAGILATGGVGVYATFLVRCYDVKERLEYHECNQSHVITFVAYSNRVLSSSWMMQFLHIIFVRLLYASGSSFR